MKTNKDDYAFANPEGRGLTKREYFASAALHGLLSDPRLGAERSMEVLSERAVIAADLLIKSLNEIKGD